MKGEKQRRADEVFGRWASEPGEKDCTGLHRAFKSRPGSPSQTKRLGKTPAEPKGKDEWEEAKEKDQSSSSVSSWGTGAYHHSQRFRDGMKAEDDSWGIKRTASERSSQEALMAGGKRHLRGNPRQPTRRSWTRSTTLMVTTSIRRGKRNLSQVLVRHLPAESDIAVKAVKDLARLRKYCVGGKLEAITSCESNTK